MNNNGDRRKLQSILPEIRDEELPIVAEILPMVLREKWTILSFLASTLIITAAVTFLTRPVYESSATVLIDTKSQQSFLTMFDVGGLEAVKNVKNELEILNSRSLRNTVAELLQTRRYVDEQETQPILIIQPEDENENTAESLREAIAKRLKDCVRFEVVRGSDAIQVIVQSPSPQEAALLAGTFSQAYQNRNLLTSRTRSRAARQFLEGQLQSRKSTLDETELRVKEYMEARGIGLLDEESKKTIDQLAHLEAQRDGTDIEIETLKKALESYREELATLEPNVARAIGEADDPYIRLLQEQLAKLEVQRDVTVAKNPGVLERDVNDRTMREIGGQITSLRKKLQERTDAYVASLAPGELRGGGGTDPAVSLSALKFEVIDSQIKLKALKAKKVALQKILGDYEKKFESIPETHIEFARLQRSRLSSEKLYLLVEEKYHEAAITEQSEFGYIDIIDPAFVPKDPVSPRKRLNFAVGALLGIALGFGYVFMKQYFDIRIYMPEDLKKRGYPVLTAVALMDDEIKKLGGKTTIERKGVVIDAHLISLVNPLSSIAESYRRLRTNIQYAQHEYPIRRILVTSANPSEGKSTTVSNLAITFAQTGKKTILIDTDLRKPNLHNEFKTEKMPGLTEVLYSGAPFETAVRETSLDNLDLLVCGSIPPNPSETLGSSRMKNLVEELMARYDIILFDSPPVLAVTDSVVLTTLADGVVVVTSAGNTRLEAFERTMEILHGVNARVLGVVLNNFDFKRIYGGLMNYKEYAYGYGYAYGSNGDGETVKEEASQHGP